jgi:hypothetical protein
LTSFSRSLVNDHWATSSGNPNERRKLARLTVDNIEAYLAEKAAIASTEPATI